MTHPARRGLIATAAAAALFALAGCNRIPDTVKIGVAQPMTGPIGALGTDMKHGVELAVQDLNEQGFKIDGKPVKLEVVAGDDQSNADKGKAVAQQMVDAGVVAVVGHLNSGVSMAAAPIYAAANIPQLAISTKPEYTQMGLPTTFRIVGNDAMQSKALGSYAASSLSGTKFAVVDDSTPYGKGLAELAAAEIKKAGKPIVVRKSLDDKTTDFTKLVPELKAAGVDVFVTTLADFQVAALCAELDKAGLPDMRVIGGDTIKTDRLPQAKLGSRGVYATSPVLEPREFTTTERFLQQYRKAYKGEPVYGAIYAYDAVYVLADAMRRSRSADPKVITEQLKRIDPIAPLTTTMRFNPDGEQAFAVIGIYKVERGTWQTQMRGSDW